MISVLSLLYWPLISSLLIIYICLDQSYLTTQMADSREIKHNNVLKMIHSQKGIFAFYWRRAASFSRILFHMYLVYFPVAVSPVAHMLNQIKICRCTTKSQWLLYELITCLWSHFILCLGAEVNKAKIFCSASYFLTPIVFQRCHSSKDI